MPRLFTGLEIPPEVATDLSLMRGGLMGARWVDTGNFHLTLRFIGDIDDAMARDVYDSLSMVERRPFKVTLNGLTSFGGDKPRAIVAAAQPARELIELQAEQERILRRIGVPPDQRKFTPHVTLAWLKSVTSSSVADYLSRRGLFLARSFMATQFVLFSARASTGGGPYLVEAAYPLG